MSQTSVFSNIQVYGKNKETVTGFKSTYVMIMFIFFYWIKISSVKADIRIHFLKLAKVWQFILIRKAS